MIIYCIYEFKVNEHSKHLEHNTDVWLDFEFNIFVSQIMSSAIFIAYAQIMKFNSVWRDRKGAFKNEYIWKSKNTQDALQYFQYENELFSLNGMYIVFFV